MMPSSLHRKQISLITVNFTPCISRFVAQEAKYIRRRRRPWLIIVHVLQYLAPLPPDQLCMQICHARLEQAGNLFYCKIREKTRNMSDFSHFPGNMSDPKPVYNFSIRPLGTLLFLVCQQKKWKYWSSSQILIVTTPMTAQHSPRLDMKMTLHTTPPPPPPTTTET